MAGIARARFIRLGPRKVGQILDLIRGKDVVDAQQILRFVPRRATRAVEKTLNSAVANTGKISEPQHLYIAQTYVCQGPVLKRMRPMAMGRGAIYKRKTCHITMVVDEKRAKTK